MVLNYSNSSEDCLFLNIWRPTRHCGQVGSCQVKLPVVIFLYGGGFQFGDSGLRVYDGRNFAALTDVVFVSLNYRLNIFGFLSADSPALPGNMGLWDQLMAFKWVKRNIGYFGGNPDDITLSGQSAGAIAAGLHSISPLSKGLFNKLIIASGTPLTMILMLSFKGIGKFVDISVALGCYDVRKDLPTQIEEILVCLKKTDASVIKSTLSKLNPARRTFVPRYGDEILPYDPLEDGDWNINVKDILIGTVQDEGTFMVHALRKTIPYFLDLLNSDHSLGISLGLKVMLDIPIASGKEIVKIYFKGYSDNPDNETLVKILSEIIGDAGFVCPTNLFAEKAAQQGVNTYRYVIAYRASYSVWPKWIGVGHGSEIPMLLGSLPIFVNEPRFNAPREERELLLKKMRYSEDDMTFMHQLLGTLYSFVHEGKPTIPLSDAEWPKYTAENPEFIYLQPNNYTRGFGPKKDRCEYWRPYLLKKKTTTTTTTPTVKTPPGHRPSDPRKTSSKEKTLEGNDISRSSMPAPSAVMYGVLILAALRALI
ncbi:acetylcholinesterase-1 [Ixodes scapularis]